MKKKIGAVLLAGVMACSMGATLALAGCGGHVQADFDWPTEGFDVTKPVTINFLHTMGANLRSVLDVMIPKFNKLYPNITVKHESAGSWDSISGQITTKITNNTNPDIAYCYPDHVALYNSYQAVQPLDDFLPGGAYANMKVKQAKDGGYEEVPFGLTEAEVDMFNPTFYEEGKKIDDGTHMYTLPWAKSTEVMYYNKTFMKNNHLEVPETWDELEQFCKDVKKIDKNLYPFTYDSEGNWFITMCEQLGSGYAVTEPMNGSHFLFDNQQNRDFVQRFASWYKENGYVMTQELNGSYTSELFTEQKAVICIGSSGGAGYQVSLDGEAGNSVFEVGIAPIPQVKPYSTEKEGYDATYKPKMISQGPSVCIFKNDDPQKVMASWLFAKFFTTSVEFEARFSIESGYMPVLKKEIMEENEAYRDEFLGNTEGDSAIKALAVKCGIDYAENGWCFVSDAFLGSSEARKQVGRIMQGVFVNPDQLDKMFKDALKACSVYD